MSKNVAQTAEAAGTATQATAQATATSISTVEKASIILTVISAALQIATAIASLFNDDESKQKEIERLQERIDQLQWELDAPRPPISVTTVPADLSCVANVLYDLVTLFRAFNARWSAWRLFVFASVNFLSEAVTRSLASASS